MLGVTVSADPAARAQRCWRSSIQNHQFRPEGLQPRPAGHADQQHRAVTAPATPTTIRTTTWPFSPRPDAPAFDPADPDPRRSQTDGRRLADALGISYAPLQTVRHADRTDLLEATAMNTALFPATLGYWLRTWMAPVVTAEAARQTRRFFTSFVTGRGPVPAVRVGNQPYGVLVTSDFSRWKYPKRRGELVLVRLFDEESAVPRASCTRCWLELEQTWDGIAADLALRRQGREPTPSDVLMNLLGLHPTSVELFQRIGYSDEYLRNLDSFKDQGRYANELASLVLVHAGDRAGLPPEPGRAGRSRRRAADEEPARALAALHDPPRRPEPGREQAALGDRPAERQLHRLAGRRRRLRRRS